MLVHEKSVMALGLGLDILKNEKVISCPVANPKSTGGLKPILFWVLEGAVSCQVAHLCLE